MKTLWGFLNRFLSMFHIYLIRSLAYSPLKNNYLSADHDYVRIQTLLLCSEEIKQKNAHGCIAEVGVYRGNFASKLNMVFPDRTLYLFDTFSGFDARDIGDGNETHSSQFNLRFSDTSEEIVMHKMIFPEKCVIKKGYFPDTAIDIDEVFVFVSIDVDLFLPTINGLKYFYPRLSKGGYIFVHDFYNTEYLGVQKAVNKFCIENEINFTPIPDISGSVIITK
jgi:O-methyltransferase